MAQTSPQLELSVNSPTVLTRLTTAAAAYKDGFAYIGGNGSDNSQLWGRIGMLMYYNMRPSDADINTIYNEHKVRFSLP